MKKSKRIRQEKKVIGQMIGIYCRRHHQADGTDDLCAGSSDHLCPDCRALLEYAEARLDRCPKGENKSSCRKCEIHCYAPRQREQVRQVMRYVGPRMLFIHPLAAILHLYRELR